MIFRFYVIQKIEKSLSNLIPIECDVRQMNLCKAKRITFKSHQHITYGLSVLCVVWLYDAEFRQTKKNE